MRASPRIQAAAEPTPPSAAEDDGATSYTLSNALVALGTAGKTAQTEEFRALRTHIMARHVYEGRRALAVCAATAGVGCSFVAANLAISLSQIGVKTLLVDANLRNPSIDKLFKPSSPVPGLAQCLASDGVAFNNFIQPEILPDLDILFSGGTPVNPQELLSTDRFSDLLSYCLRQYQMTILDNAPASSCSDLHRVSGIAGYSLIVAGRDKTLVNDLKILAAQIESDHARVAGTVLTEA